MNRSIVKIGGSVLRTPGDLARVVAMVRDYRCPPVVVVSAFAGITDLLESAACDPTLSDRDALREIETRTADFLTSIEATANGAAAWHSQLRARLRAAARLCQGIQQDSPTDGRRQLLMSYGERLSSLVITIALTSAGIACREALPEEIGLKVRDGTIDGEIDLPASRSRVRRSLRDPVVTVVPGFYGVTEVGAVRLLGRNSSDYSAAALAHCLETESLDLYKDSHGIQTADPREVDGTLPIRRLSFAEARLISRFGGKVLHSRSVEPVAQRNIPIRVYGPQLSPAAGPGTVVTDFHQQCPQALAVVSLPEVRLVEIVLSDHHGSQRVTVSSLHSDLHANVIATARSPRSELVVVPEHSCERVAAAIRDALPTAADVIVSDPVSLVAIIGEGGNRGDGIMGNSRNSTGRHRWPELVWNYAPGVRWSTVLPPQRQRTVQRLHDQLLKYFSRERSRSLRCGRVLTRTVRRLGA